MANQERMFIALVAITAVVGLVVLFAGSTGALSASESIGYCTVNVAGLGHVRPVTSAEECLETCPERAKCSFQLQGASGAFGTGGKVRYSYVYDPWDR